eukprot:13878-Eustigmatos_ZCMA.PRE.1
MKNRHARSQEVPADMRLTRSIILQVDESALTGESVPVDKNAAHTYNNGTSTSNEVPSTSDRPTLVYAGTVVTRGRAC